MSNRCSIIMYHYVRELPYTRYPEIKGLKTSLFKEQLAYMQKYYTFVRGRDLIAAPCTRGGSCRSARRG